MNLKLKQKTPLQTASKEMPVTHGNSSTILSELPDMNMTSWRLTLANNFDNLILREQLEQLSQHSLEPNPFYTLSMLSPAISNLTKSPLQYLCLWRVEGASQQLVFFLPVLVKRTGFTARRILEGWVHKFGPLGTPLLHGGDDPETILNALSCSFGDISSDRFAALIFRKIPKKSRIAAYLATTNNLAGRSLRFAVSSRAGLSSDQFAKVTACPAGGKRKKRLHHAMRKLEGRGEVTFQSARTPAEIRHYLNLHLSLECRGWKGRKGTAILNNASDLQFVERAISSLADKKTCQIECLCLDGKPVASLILIEMQGYIYPWKIAFDETHSDCSVGNLLISQVNQLLGRKTGIRGIDSLASETNATAYRHWPNRLEMSDLIVGFGPDAEASAFRIAQRNEFNQNLKRTAKALLGRTL